MNNNLEYFQKKKIFEYKFPLLIQTVDLELDEK